MESSDVRQESGSAETQDVNARPGDALWAERAGLQVRKMEQTLEQDLSKAMAGLREQFRQGPAEFGGQGHASSLDTTTQVAPRADAVAMAEFRSEAAAARDEMLDGLARLRRELETQRMQQAGGALSAPSPLVGRPGAGAGAGGERELPEAAIAELRRELLGQQAAMAELRRDIAVQQDVLKRSASQLDREVARLSSEVESSKGRLGEGPSLGRLADDVQHLLRRVESLEASDMRRSFPSPSHDMSPEIVEQLASALQAEVERRSAEDEDLHRRIDGVLGLAQETAGELASKAQHIGGTHGAGDIQELAQRIAVERASRESQVIEMRTWISEEVRSHISGAASSLRGEVQECIDSLAMQLRNELAEGSLGGGAGGHHGGQHEEVGSYDQATYDHYGQEHHQPMMGATQPSDGGMLTTHSSVNGSMPPGDAMPDGTFDVDAVSREGMLSHDLKESLEQLVEKVHRTLRKQPHSEGSGSRDVQPSPVQSNQYAGPSRSWQPQVSSPTERSRGHTIAVPSAVATAPSATPIRVPVRQCSSVSIPGGCATPGGGVRPGSVRVMQGSVLMPVSRQVVATPVPGPAMVAVRAVSPQRRVDTMTSSASMADIPLSELMDSKDTFKKCLEDLRAENEALRAGDPEFQRRVLAPAPHAGGYSVTLASGTTPARDASPSTRRGRSPSPTAHRQISYVPVATVVRTSSPVRQAMAPGTTSL